VLTAALKDQLGDAFELTDFGEQTIRGHSPTRLWGLGTKGLTTKATIPPSADEY
jgi:hypothetical protein